jgi:hypothetical protein
VHEKTKHTGDIPENSPARKVLLRSKNLSVAEKIAQISQENCDDPEVKLEAFPSVQRIKTFGVKH